MPDASVILAPAPDDPEGRAAARACAVEALRAQQQAMLQELAEIGMQMARAVRDEALAPVEPDAPKPPSRFGNGDLGLVYSRIARAVRQTLALQIRVADDIEKARFEQRRAHVASVRAAFEERQHEIRDYVAEAIEAEAAEKKSSDREVERLLDDLDERLDAGDYDDTLNSAPIGELVARICADLGVIPDWHLWDHDWVTEHLTAQTLAGDLGAERWDFPQTRPAPRPPEAHDHPPDTG